MLLDFNWFDGERKKLTYTKFCHAVIQKPDETEASKREAGTRTFRAFVFFKNDKRLLKLMMINFLLMINQFRSI